METRVRFVGVPRESETAKVVERRIEFALDRHAGAVRGVVATLSDENGPKGGKDKRCVLHVRLRTGGAPVVVRALAESSVEAVSAALEHLRRRLERRANARSAA